MYTQGTDLVTIKVMKNGELRKRSVLKGKAWDGHIMSALKLVYKAGQW